MLSQTKPKSPTRGPLRVHPRNPRYFVDRDGNPVFLTGSHTWANWVEHKIDPSQPDFPYSDYLDFMVSHHHNFMRFWGWEHARWATWDGTGNFHIHPLPYARTGPGVALDGLPKFDLHRFDSAYFERLQTRVEEAGRRGIYAAVKLFDGFSVGFKGPQPDPRKWIPERNPFRGHPFHSENNINGIDGDPENTGEGKSIHTLRIPAITALHEAFVRAVVDTVNEFDNVLYEICNESDQGKDTIDWQYHFIHYIRELEAVLPNQHPIGMTVPYPGVNEPLFQSPADWISPNWSETEPYRDDPPPADGSKVIISDTDHLWGHGAELAWAWKSFTRGMHVILMDPWEPLEGSDLHDNNYRYHPTWEPVRLAMGDLRRYAERMDLAKCLPDPDITSTRYALASPGRECLIYQPNSGAFSVNLRAWSGNCHMEWFHPRERRVIPGDSISGGQSYQCEPPFSGDAVLYITSDH